MLPNGLEVKNNKPEAIGFICEWFESRGYEGLSAKRNTLGFYTITNKEEEFELCVKIFAKDFIIQVIDFSNGALGLGTEFITDLIQKLKEEKFNRIIANNCSPNSIVFYQRNRFVFEGRNAVLMLN